MGEEVVVHLVYGELQDLMQVLQAVEAIACVLFVAQEEPKKEEDWSLYFDSFNKYMFFLTFPSCF